jgi:acetyltransferase-like isoleucine patch superfamily enzyme
MKVKFGKIKKLLMDHRVFFGGQSLDGPPPFYSNDLAIEVPKNYSCEPYCTYWGKNGIRLASMGSFSYTRSVLPEIITVGRYTSIANGLTTLGDRHPHEWASTCPSFYSPQSGLMKALAIDTGAESSSHTFNRTKKNIKIGNDVWIGQNVTLAQGITIGDGAVIAANSLVVKDVAPYSIVGGNPAKPIKNRFNDYIIDAMKALQWWKYSVQDLAEMDVTNPHVFCHQLTSRIAEGRIQEFKPSKINFEDIMRTLREETEST